MHVQDRITKIPRIVVGKQSAQKAQSLMTRYGKKYYHEKYGKATKKYIKTCERQAVLFRPETNNFWFDPMMIIIVEIYDAELLMRLVVVL